jgi:hypothetical protein
MAPRARGTATLSASAIEDAMPADVPLACSIDDPDCEACQ